MNLGEGLNKRRLITLSFFLICLASIIVGFFYWYSKQLAEQKLQDYIKRLEDLGFITEERSLESFQVDDLVTIHFFGDFRSFAKQEDINHMYYDRGIQALYFLLPIGDRVEANVFYYK